MPPFNPPTYKPGDLIRASDKNAQNREIQRLGQVRGGSAIAARSGPGGLEIDLLVPEEIDAQLTSTADADGGYQWQEVIFDGTAWSTTGRTGGNLNGGSNYDPTYERRIDDRTLSAGPTVFRMIRSPTSGAWLFAHRVHPCPGTVCAQANDCKGNAISGASVTIAGPGGPWSGTTDAHGHFCQDVGINTGTFTVTITIPSGPSLSGNVTISKSCDIQTCTLRFADQVCINTVGCDGPLSGLAVSVSGAGGGGTTSGTTDASGKWCYSPANALNGTLTVSVTYNGRTVNQTATYTLNAPGPVCSLTFAWVTRICACITSNCTNGPFTDITATLSLTVNGNAAGSANTDSSGQACITPTYGTIPGDSITLNASAGSDYTTGSYSFTLPSILNCPSTTGVACLPVSSVSGGNPPCRLGDPCNSGFSLFLKTSWYNFLLYPIAGRCCAPSCGDDTLPSTIHVSDGIGSVSLISGSSGQNGCLWLGCATRTAALAGDHNCLNQLPNTGVTVAFGLTGPGVSGGGSSLGGRPAIACGDCNAGAVDLPTYDATCGNLESILFLGSGAINVPVPTSVTVNSCSPWQMTAVFNLPVGSPLRQIYGPTVTLIYTL
ncbi:MAG TPA: hypothetical protein VN719_09600 [Gemmatimonadales bacterium]|nr:hypothetical protein [Gemmatimonadales bacterium]